MRRRQRILLCRILCFVNPEMGYNRMLRQKGSMITKGKKGCVIKVGNIAMILKESDVIIRYNSNKKHADIDGN